VNEMNCVPCSTKEARKYEGVIPPITMTSLREAVKQRREKPFMAFGGMMNAGL
jgi:hypothetical protein